MRLTAPPVDVSARLALVGYCVAVPGLSLWAGRPGRRRGSRRFKSGLEGDCSSGRAYFELMPCAYRDPSLRRRIAALYQQHVATSLAIIVSERADSAEIARSAQAIAHLVFAAGDGVELHYHMDPVGYRLDEVFELLLGFVLAETRRLTGG
jgi:hypothetical protein